MGDHLIQEERTRGAEWASGEPGTRGGGRCRAELGGGVLRPGQPSLLWASQGPGCGQGTCLSKAFWVHLNGASPESSPRERPQSIIKSREAHSGAHVCSSRTFRWACQFFGGASLCWGTKLKPSTMHPGEGPQLQQVEGLLGARSSAELGSSGHLHSLHPWDSALTLCSCQGWSWPLIWLLANPLTTMR